MLPLKHLVSVSALLCLSLPPILLFFDSRSSSVSDDSSALRVVQVRRVAAPRELKIMGELIPAEITEIRTRLGGTVAELRVKAGDNVSSGTVLAVIRSSEVDDRIARYETGLRDAQSELQRRERDWLEAAKILESRRDLVRQDLIARSEIEDHEAAAAGARAALDLARAHLEQQQAMLAQARALRARAEIRAMSRGQVARLNVRAGDPVSAGATVLTLDDLDELRLVGRIGSAEASGLQIGASARVNIAGVAGGKFAGEIIRVTEGESHTTEVEIAIDNRQRFLRSGAAAEAWVAASKRSHDLFVPRSAVISEDNFHYVYRVDQGRPRRHEIEIGPEESAAVTVRHGLAEGDWVYDDANRVRIGESRKQWRRKSNRTSS